MNSSNARIGIAMLSLVAVLLVVLADAGRESPGELSVVHGREADLSGTQSCNACHGGWFGNMTESCLSCHDAIENQLNDGTGLHGSLGAGAAGCARCHSDHHGPGFALVNAQSFAQAGASREDFDHSIVGFRMKGKHLELACKSCHDYANVAVLPKGAQRFLGLEQDCASCHDDAHEGRMQLGCATCHGQDSFDQLEAFGHEKHLPLTGGHEGLACTKCHEPGGQRSLDSLGAGLSQPTRTCVDCHVSPHDAAFVDGAARLARVDRSAGCTVCHKQDHSSFRDERIEVSTQQHAHTGFALEFPHDKAECSQCHAAEETAFDRRYPGRKPDGCASCHDDPHGGQFDTGPFAAEGCIACHDRHQFEPHAFTPEKHARAALPLTGRHLEIECEECHRIPSKDLPRTFRGTLTTCVGCHKDAHRGFFEEFAAEHRTPAPDTCAECHSTETFSEIAEHAFDHGRWTRFDVQGAHAQTDCETCHPASHQPDEHGRTFGRVADHRGPFRGCVTCHTDPHAGGFDAAHLPASVDGRTDCARCHAQSSFRTFPHGFDHGKWTGFALEGQHAEASCAACHAPLAAPEDHGRTWSRARGTRCQDCHEDPHAGQFEQFGQTDCRRCHKSSASFSMLAFRHNLDSRFPLSKAHEKVACSSCHVPFEHEGREIVRYKPMRRDCASCHGNASSPFRRR